MLPFFNSSQCGYDVVQSPCMPYTSLWCSMCSIASCFLHSSLNMRSLPNRRKRASEMHSGCQIVMRAASSWHHGSLTSICSWHHAHLTPDSRFVPSQRGFFPSIECWFERNARKKRKGAVSSGWNCSVQKYFSCALKASDNFHLRNKEFSVS